MDSFSAAVAVVARADLYPDSKTFVDMPAKGDLHAAHQRVAACAGLGIAELRKVLSECFNESGSDLADEAPSGWEPSCPSLQHCCTPAGRQLAQRVHMLWPHLSKRIFSESQGRSTLLTLPRPMIVAGSRFRELYYWDSFWTLKGLLASGMRESALNIVQNFLHLIQQHGFVPNGSRAYYLNRSQPPLLAAMLDLVQQHPCTHHLPVELVPLCIDCMKREHTYWTRSPKQVMIQDAHQRTFVLSRYYADWEQPRPESYKEDHALAQGLSEDAAQTLWREVASAAESGWDFSSRWFQGKQGLKSIRTTQIIPVELNVFLWNLERVLSKWMASAGDEKGQQQFEDLASKRAAAIEALMWCPEEQRWNDLLLQHKSPSSGNSTASSITFQYTHSGAVHACCWTPLLFGMQNPEGSDPENMILAMKNSGLVRPGGLATTLVETDQQWDRSNSWPPLVALWVDGLKQYAEKHESQSAATLADTLAKTFLSSVADGLDRTGHVWEKYCSDSVGSQGAGGEYDVQIGFGWSIGTTLHFLVNLEVNW